MAITTYVDFVNNYLVKNGMIGNATNINKAPDRLKLELDEINLGNSAANILVKLKTVDGSGSGLDADLLDGMNATNANTATTVVSRDASGNFSAGIITAALSGNAGTATALQTARTIGGVSFDGTANITLPGVNAAGNQNTTGNAATATALQTARTINGTSFNGTANITTANWGTARTITIGATGKSVNGSDNVSWTLAEMGAAPINSPTFIGNPTAPTAVQFDNDTSLATTAFVQRSLGSFSGKEAYTDNINLTATSVGKWILLGATSYGKTISLPDLSTIPDGATLSFYNWNHDIGIAARPGQSITSNVNALSMILKSGESITLVKENDLVWNIVGGSGQLPYSNLFARSLSGNGYQKLPGGLIIQWGNVVEWQTNGGYTAYSYPIRFPNNCFICIGNRGAPGENALMNVGKAGGDPQGQFIVQNWGPSSGELVNWFAVGN